MSAGNETAGLISELMKTSNIHTSAMSVN